MYRARSRLLSLIYLCFREWLKRDSRVLLMDPSYGEYSHITEHILRCWVDRLPLHRENDYDIDLRMLEEHLRDDYDMVVIVNPNSPTGRHVRRRELEAVLLQAPPETRIWIDETYVDYASDRESLEIFAACRQNVVVCKSLSKGYALSGARAAYLCAAPAITSALREISPPWAVSLPAQLAVVKALADPEYYAARYRETHVLREALASGLCALGIDVIPSMANFVLCHLPLAGPDAATICERCRTQNVFLRDAGRMSSRLGSHALRVAVKDRESNSRIVETLRWGMGKEQADLEETRRRAS